MRLANKIALITGGARGIGEATAKAFAAEGAHVIITDINDQQGNEVVSSLAERSEYLHLDVSKPEDWQRVHASILAKYGRIDILVNNAGITGFLETSGPHDPEHLDLVSWQKVNSVNIDGVVLGCQVAIKLMKKSTAASIVNISSRSGIVGIPAAAAYAASKAAVRNHTKTVALYCAEKGYPIRCNSIHPGAILTPMWDAMLGEGEARIAAIKAVASDIPLGTMGTPEDVAYAALYLASNESKYVTGIELNIDGGILAGSAAAPTQEM
ncbi:glucose 1-dehydrogenase [Glaciecola sp. KUL10]|uniref:glucose 1-dehydrogenase n=1 Tax=Glaciecola sp. (strain KUL10) TaxID=2161813 RepID=UPI000D78A79B|nr:glucose 1-dehydrogenase [Glaciecola sp. KUL10]GBL05221.1 3-alpha-(or 20-beta)-hydroxysteroid dehydrogenase [Glaciecola sp. KUL10]